MKYHLYLEKNKINQKVNSQYKPVAQIIHSKNRKVDNNYDYTSEYNESKVNIPKNVQRPILKKQVIRDDKNKRKEETRSVLMMPENHENIVKSENKLLQKEEKKYINQNGILRHEQPLAQNERSVGSQIVNFGVLDSNSIRSNIRSHVKDGKMDLAAYQIPQQSTITSHTHRLRASDLVGSRNRTLNTDAETYEIEPSVSNSNSRTAINIKKQVLQNAYRDVGDNIDSTSNNTGIRNNIIKKTQSIQIDNVNHQLPQETVEMKSLDRSNVYYQDRNLDKQIENHEISVPVKNTNRFYFGKEMKRTFDKNQNIVHTETAVNTNFRELNYKDERNIQNFNEIRDNIEINPSESKTYLGVESQRTLNTEKIENNIDITPSNHDANREFTRKRERVVISAELILDEVNGPNIDRQERRFIQNQRTLDVIDNDEYDGGIDINSQSQNRTRIVENKQKLENKPTQEFLVHNNNQNNIR